MDIPSEKNSATPATGASSRVHGQPAAPHRPPEENGSGVEFGDDFLELPVISLPLRDSRQGPSSDVPRVPDPPSSGAKEAEPRTSKKKPLEKRTGAVSPNFKRLMTRPQTTYAADAALDQTRAESAVDMGKIDHESMQFGKIHPHAAPDYRPNRLFRVLDGIYTHSPLKWLDVFDRVSIRFIVFTVLSLSLVGLAVVRYFGSFGAREGTAGPGEKMVMISASDRVARGRAAVEGFLAARTIEDRLPFVLDPGRAADRMNQFYGAMQGSNPQLSEVGVGEPVAGLHGTWLPLNFRDTAGRTVTIVMGEDDNGCRIDWENFVAFGEVPWEEFCRTRPTSPKSLRVRLRQVEKYEGSYTREGWQSYEVEHRSGAPALLGYASRSGRQGQQLASLVQGDKWQAALVYLRFEAAATGKLVVIDDVVRTRWQDEQTMWTNP